MGKEELAVIGHNGKFHYFGNYSSEKSLSAAWEYAIQENIDTIQIMESGKIIGGISIRQDFPNRWYL